MKIYDYEVPDDRLDYFKHFPIDISQEIQSYITDKVMDWSRYIFTHREGRKQWGYCTHCRQEHPTETTLKHGYKADCPHCNSSCYVKSSGRGRSALTDRTYTLWYEKSKSDPNVVIARGFYAIRDYSNEFKDVNTEFKVIAVYLFQPGGGRMMSKDYYGSGKYFIERSTVYSEAKHSMKYVNSYHNVQSLKKAVKKTFLQYSTWEQYSDTDYLDIIDLASRYKCVEFLTKVGLRSLVQSKLLGGGTYGAVNWNGMTPQKILRLSMPHIKSMQKYGTMQPSGLRSYQISQKDGSNLNWEEASLLSDLNEKHNQSDVQKITEYLTVTEMKKYFAKQLQLTNEDGRRVYRSGMTILRDWKDYIRECSQLAIDTTRDSMRFPKNLHAAHQETSQKIKHITDERVTAQIKAREKILQEFYFEHDGLLLRPASTADELFSEGKKLKHCVGSYASSHAEGRTNIFFLRKLDNPDEPFFTLELKIERIGHGTVYKIIQCRGKGNCDTTQEIKAFIGKFEQMKLSPKARAKVRVKNKIQVEVAI